MGIQRYCFARILTLVLLLQVGSSNQAYALSCRGAMANIAKAGGLTLAHGIKATFYPIVLGTRLAHGTWKGGKFPKLPASVREAIDSGRIKAFEFIKKDGTHALLFLIATATGYHPLVVSELYSGTSEDEIFEEAKLMDDTKNEKNVLYISLHPPNSPEETMTALSYLYRFSSNKNSAFVPAKDYSEIQEIIRLYVQQNGPIDSLVIDSHGLPATVMDSKYGITKETTDTYTLHGYFKPNAKIISNTCYTGSSGLRTGSGENFLKSLGNSLLSKGGKVYGFRRISEFTPPNEMSEQHQKIYENAEKEMEKTSDFSGLEFLSFVAEQQIRRVFHPEKFTVVEVPPK